nr:hypothetical protein [Tanacetum cinerariifolium]
MATETTMTTTTITTHPPPPQPQQSTTYSILIKRIGELEQIMANLIQDNKHLEERLDSHGSRLYTLENLKIPQQNRFRDLPEADMKEILHQRMWKTNSYKAHEDHMMLYEALEKPMSRDHTDELLTYLAEARKKKKKRHDSLKTPPGHNVSKPLPLGGPPGQVTIQYDFFFNKDVEYLRYGSKGGRPALSISKMKASCYPDVGLEQMVPNQMWIEEEFKYTSEGDRKAVRTYMQILSVVRIKVFSMYRSPKPSTTQRQEDSHYCSQLMDQTLGYQTTRRRLLARD